MFHHLIIFNKNNYNQVLIDKRYLKHIKYIIPDSLCILYFLMNKFSLKNNTKYNNPNLSFSSESNNAQKSILDTIQNVGEILNQIDNIEKNDGTNLIEELQRLSEMLGLRKTDEQTAKVCLNNLAYFYNIDGNFCEEEKESFHKQCEHWGTPQQIEEAIFLDRKSVV